MEIVGFLAIILFLATALEGLIEYFFGKIFDHIPAAQPYSWLLMYVAAIFGVIGTFHYQLDLVSLLASFMKLTIPVSWFGIILTGLAIGRGSNYLHDLISKFFEKPA